MIYDRLQHIKVEIENDRQQKMIDQYNDAVHAYNKALAFFNEFIDYRNKQFTPIKPDAEIQAMLDVTDSQILKSKTLLKTIPEPSASIITSSDQLMKSIDDVAVKLKEQQDWLKQYFLKGKSGRKSMFYEKKVTWFGIPIKN